MNTKQLIATLAFTFVAGAQAATPAMPGQQAADGAAAVVAPQFDAGKFDQHIKAMQAIHQQFMAARTPEERDALRQTGMAAMQDGMTMMKQMPMGGDMPMGKHMGGMGMANGMPMDCAGADRRTEMMDMMMKLMNDQQLPAKQ
ncbi:MULTISPECIES: hypothetical protein [Pseudomonas]|uniref:DUF4175 domain-containing protein n=1 Tax=Pseudomonas spirodelae TaxID=3101751 RepID=A0ABU5PDZ2_9PSED|nr:MULTISPECIES: hypothetical protein [unclassified Pseudomonas]MBU0902201.1 hypothetical protein [Gammaproteobacteria bacterium]MDD2161802.1 hypothetical protein [Pseudomonas sp. MIL19]MEA1607897.1 hypothetical protein [Pseudomonas sp. T5W1]